MSGRAPRASKAVRTLFLLCLVATLTGAGTFAAFSSTTQNSGNVFQAGTVVISDNDLGSMMFNLSQMSPETPTASRCIVTTYGGSLPATVRLYGTTAGTGLDQYIDLTVTRGTIATPSGSSCSGFAADAANHRGLGAGVLYFGTLRDFADDYATGLVDATTATPESWTNGETRAYRFDVSLKNAQGAAGTDATQTFTWEARNL